MDAVKFLKTKNRMCKTNVLCKNCPLDAYKDECDTVDVEDFKMIKIISIVEQWGEEHPVKTYKDAFLEKFPNVQIDKGNIEVPWCDIFNEGICKYEEHDTDACYKCWDEPIEG